MCPITLTINSPKLGHSNEQTRWEFAVNFPKRRPRLCHVVEGDGRYPRAMTPSDIPWTVCIILRLNCIWPFCYEEFSLWAIGSFRGDYHWLIENVHHFSLLNLSESAWWIIAYWTEYDWVSSPHWGRGEMTTILQTAFWNQLSCQRCCILIQASQKYVPTVWLTLSRKWFRWWLGTEQVRSLYLRQWCLSLLILVSNQEYDLVIYI